MTIIYRSRLGHVESGTLVKETEKGYRVKLENGIVTMFYKASTTQFSSPDPSTVCSYTNTYLADRVNQNQKEREELILLIDKNIEFAKEAPRA